jgi:hypothetical protein
VSRPPSLPCSKTASSKINYTHILALLVDKTTQSSFLRVSDYESSEALGQMISGRLSRVLRRHPEEWRPALVLDHGGHGAHAQATAGGRVQLSCSCVRRTIVRLMLLLRPMPFATYVGNAWRSVTIIIAILGVEVNFYGSSLSTLCQFASMAPSPGCTV